MLTNLNLRSQVDALWDKFWTVGLANLQRLQEESTEVVERCIESLRGRMSKAERQVEGLFESLLAESFGGN